MNKQQGPNRIEWTERYGPGSGRTWNAGRGCKHRCGWVMPDGTFAQCYAKSIAEGVARSAYKNGFEEYQWNPDKLDEPLKEKQPCGIFLDSMSDLMGHWVIQDHIQQVLDVCERAHWHTFFLLTKNAVRLPKFHFPPNVWVGISSPPSTMNGNWLSETQQRLFFGHAAYCLLRCDAKTKWVSFEPLAYDIAEKSLGDLHDLCMDTNFKWAVVGAASRGKNLYQPDPLHVAHLLQKLDKHQKAVFFKGNLRPSLGKAFSAWREEFPTVEVVKQGALF